MEDPLRRQARAAPDAPALEWRDGSWRYGELDAAADRVARGLAPLSRETAEAGRTPVVAAFLPATPAGVAALHGVPRAGAALAPLHLGWTDPELAFCLARLRPAAVLATEETEAAAARTAAGVAVLRLEEAATDGPGGEAGGKGTLEGRYGALEPHGEERDARERRLAHPHRRPGTRRSAGLHSILATSGSSGRPKLVMLSPANHLASARAAIRRLALGPGDRWLASLPFAHVGGLALALRAAVAGCALVLRERFDPEEWNHLFETGAATHASLVPTMLRRLLAARSGRPAPPGARCLLLGGAPTDPALLEEALDLGWPLALTYGLTEAASQVATAPPELVRRKPGTAGPPLEGLRLRLSPEGEIRVRGPVVTAGYWDEPAEERLAEGWLRTGDLGRVDPEGHLWVAGRTDSRIVTGGVNVDPAEVEAVLLSHPAVREAVVVGVPDPEWGERVAAAVEPAAPDAVEGPALEALCRERLAGPKRPRRWTFLEKLPRTATGKPDREAVRRLFQTGRPEAGRGA